MNWIAWFMDENITTISVLHHAVRFTYAYGTKFTLQLACEASWRVCQAFQLIFPCSLWACFQMLFTTAVILLKIC